METWSRFWTRSGSEKNPEAAPEPAPQPAPEPAPEPAPRTQGWRPHTSLCCWGKTPSFEGNPLEQMHLPTSQDPCGWPRCVPTKSLRCPKQAGTGKGAHAALPLLFPPSVDHGDSPVRGSTCLRACPDPKSSKVEKPFAFKSDFTPAELWIHKQNNHHPLACRLLHVKCYRKTLFGRARLPNVRAAAAGVQVLSVCTDLILRGRGLTLHLHGARAQNPLPSRYPEIVEKEDGRLTCSCTEPAHATPSIAGE